MSRTRKLQQQEDWWLPVLVVFAVLGVMALTLIPEWLREFHIGVRLAGAAAGLGTILWAGSKKEAGDWDFLLGWLGIVVSTFFLISLT